MYNKTIESDCEHMFPIYDGMTEEQIEKTHIAREGGAVLAKLKDIRFYYVKSRLFEMLSCVFDRISFALEHYKTDWNAEELKSAMDAVLDEIQEAKAKLKEETLGPDNGTSEELPF